MIAESFVLVLASVASLLLGYVAGFVEGEKKRRR